MYWLVLSAASYMMGIPGGELIYELLGGGSGGGAPGVGPAAPLGPDATPVFPKATLVASVLLTGVIAAGTKHVTRDNVLEHDARKQMYEYIWETGAAHLRRIATALDLSTTNATWHLDKLVKAGLIGEVKANGYRMYYPRGAGRIMKDQCLVAAQVQSENARSIMDYVAENPGSHQREIARALDINHGTVRWHLSRLEDADILASRQDGRATAYRLTDHAEHVLSTMPPIQMQDDAQTA